MSERDHDISSIRDSFIQDGVSWEIDSNMKLQHLWKKLQRTEDALRSSHSENTTLKKEKKEEMDAVHQYLDEIRNLSTKKEQLAKELEDENTLLKSETAQIRMENEALLAQIQLVTSKLTFNEGIQQQLPGKTITEQVDFFLEERSNHITRLEELQNELQVANNSKSDLQQQLTKMQTSLEKQKEKNQSIIQKTKETEENATKSIEDLKKLHEKEKFEVFQKYFKITAQMGESNQKNVKLQEEIKSLKENLAMLAQQHQLELKKAKDATKAELEQIYESKLKKLTVDGETTSTKLTAEINSVMQERDSTKQKLSEVMEQLRGAQEHVRQLQSEQTQKTSLQETQLATAEEEIEQLKQTHTSMATTLVSLQAELKEAHAREIKLKDVTSQHDQTIVSYKQQLHDASSQVSALTNQLQETTELKDAEINQLKMALANSKSAVQSLQHQLQSSETQMATKVDQFKAQIKSSNDAVTQLQTELRHQHDIKHQLEEELKNKLDTAGGEVTNVRQQLKETKEANILLATQLEQKQKELEAANESIGNREEAHQHQQLLLSGETQKVTKQLENAQVELRIKQESNDMLQSELVRVRDQNTQLANETSQLNITTAELRDQLASAEQDITLLKQEASQLQEDNRNKTSDSSRLQTIQVQHEATIVHLQSELEAVKLECSQLKQEHGETQTKLSADIQRLEESNRVMSDERDTLAGKLQSATDTYKTEKTRTQEEIKHLQKMLQEVQNHSQQQAEELKATKEMTTQSTSNITKELNEELKLCKEKIASMEEENHQLNLQGSKIQEQLMQLEEKAAVAGASKLKADQELTKQLHVCRRTESKLAKSLNEKAAINKELQAANETIKQYKQKVDDMAEKMFNETQQREWIVKEKASIEERLRDTDTLQSQLKETKELLQQEKLNVALLEQSQEGHTDQMESLKNTVSNLQASLDGKQAENVELKSSVKIQKQKSKKLLEQVKQLEAENQAEREQVTALQQQINALQLDIISMEGHLEDEHKRMSQKSRRSLDKLCTSKEKHTKERLSLESSISTLQEELRSAKLRLEKEAKWREDNQALLKALLEEKSQLLFKLATAEDEEQQKLRLLADAEGHIRQLQHENELIEAKNKSLLTWQQDNAASYSLENSMNLSGSFRGSTHTLPVRSELQSPT